MKERRTVLVRENPQAGEELARHFFDSFRFPSSFIIGGYWPVGSELDLKPLLDQAITQGFQCALPCITPQGLLFRLWKPPMLLEKGPFQICEPPATSALVFPDVLLVPLLAFDQRGHRLGYGQGYFDQFLDRHPTLTIGIGFAGQAVEALPEQPHDRTLDYILTERGLISRHA